MNTDRREFLKIAAALAATQALASSLFADDANAANQGIPYRTLGHTNEKVSCVGLGGHHIGIPKDENEGIAIIRSALNRGINFLDNSWDYHNGNSEIRMGKALKDGYRAKAFVMTKIDGRTKKSAAAQIDESLKRLGVDHIDLMQHHEVIRLEDPDRIFDEGGAQEAMMDAKQAGKIRHIGFTGHKDPYVHLRMIQVAKDHGFKFDTVQMPLNVMDAHFRSFGQQVLPVLVQQNIGVLGMKPLASGAVLKSNTGVSAIECLHFAMNLPTSVVITGCQSMKDLDQAIEAAKSFKPMAQDQVAALLAKTAQAAATGKFEGFKTTPQFDATAKHPEYLG
jgi:predicted aldo/keto reductase-like oxidoreductase